MRPAPRAARDRRRPDRAPLHRRRRGPVRGRRARRRGRRREWWTRAVPGAEPGRLVPLAPRRRRRRLRVGERPRRRHARRPGRRRLRPLRRAGPRPTGTSSRSSTRSSPTASRAAASTPSAPAWAIERAWDEPVEAGRDTASREWYGGDLRGIAQRLDHVEALGANVVYLTPIFPAGSTHRYDAHALDRVDPLLGGDAALDELVRAAHGRGMRVVADLTTNHVGSGARLVPRGTGGRGRGRARLLPLRRRDPARLRGVVGDPDAAEAQLALARAARADARDRPLAGSTAGSTAGGSTSRT